MDDGFFSDLYVGWHWAKTNQDKVDTIYIGYDPGEHVAYQACVNSIQSHQAGENEVPIIPLLKSQLEADGLYSRTDCGSTEFSFSRFLVPYLNQYEGWAMFVDCDFVFNVTLNELFAQVNDKYAVMCVKHDYTPKTAIKMDGKVQTVYNRKNWSSLMLINCEHPAVKELTVQAVNNESGAWLHQFAWLKDEDIGELDAGWNWLEGEYDKPAKPPHAIHLTLGGPWFGRTVEYAGLWQSYADIKVVEPVTQVSYYF